MLVVEVVDGVDGVTFDGIGLGAGDGPGDGVFVATFVLEGVEVEGVGAECCVMGVVGVVVGETGEDVDGVAGAGCVVATCVVGVCCDGEVDGDVLGVVFVVAVVVVGVVGEVVGAGGVVEGAPGVRLEVTGVGVFVANVLVGAGAVGDDAFGGVVTLVDVTAVGDVWVEGSPGVVALAEGSPNSML